jgi:dolichol-phosphate mannosyltransferase
MADIEAQRPVGTKPLPAPRAPVLDSEGGRGFNKRTMSDRPTYSVVVPVYNEAAALPELLRRLTLSIERLDGSCEVILVDDGSTDDGYGLMAAARESDPRFKLLRLSRNFGHQIAVTAGLDAAEGDAVIVMDADLQDPPEVMIEMAARWREGFEVVYAVRQQRHGETRFKRATATAFYRLFRRMTEVDVPIDVGDFRLVDRRALMAFRSMRETNRYVRGMFSWIGFSQVGVPFKRDERFAGQTKYPLRKMIKFATDGIVSFSSAPLRLALKAGFVVSALSFLMGVVFLASKIAGFYSVPGLASIAVFVAFLGGIQLLLLGIMGEYIARIHDEVKQRPLYLVSDAQGIASGPARAVPEAQEPLRTE